MKFLRIMKTLLLFVIAAGTAYQVLALVMVALFKRKQDVPIERECWPPVSIFKPLCGMDEQLRENLESFCVQDYPRYEVLMGFSDQNDGAMTVAQDVAGSFPETARVIIKEGMPGTNRKVANLIGLESESRFEFLALSDSDMRVGPNYLKTVMFEYLTHYRAGLVTCPYMVRHPASLGAALESLTIASDLFPAILVARRLEGITFGLGASLLLRKSVLHDIGGLHTVAEYLADDYRIGNLIYKKGYQIVLSSYVMDDMVGPMSLGDHVIHQLRWAATYRASRPKGYLAYGITHVFPWALISLSMSRPSMSALPAAALLLRSALALLVNQKVIHRVSWFRFLAFLPLKDVISFGIWLAGLFSKTVSWRGRTYEVQRGGRMRQVKKPLPPRFTPR